MKSKKIYIYITSLFFLFFLYFSLTLIFKENLFFPKISNILLALRFILSDANSYMIIINFLLRLFVSSVIGFLIGVVLSILCYRYNYLYYFIKPYVLIFKSLPIVSISLILLYVFKANFSLYFIVLFMIVPIVFENSYQSFINIDKDLFRITFVYSGFNFKTIINTFIPMNLKTYKSSFFLIIGFAAKVLVTAEFITNAPFSLGQQIMLYSTYLQYNYVYAWTLVLISIVFLFELISFITNI